ncbi:MAG: peptide ABC transporter substrate-binding protein [Clostridia bacterium]|nr:peptide ABC transporter substrate-binding protein [Clostridia bacterium]
MKRFFAIVLAAALLLSVLSISVYAEDDKKVLHWYIGSEITTMDSGKTYDIYSGEAVSYFSDPLYRLDENDQPIPNLAVALPEVSEDGLTVTITIRDDACYSNGEKVVAADVVYAIQRIYDPAVGSQNGSTTAFRNRDAVRSGELPVEELGVKALSDTVIEISLDAADPFIEHTLTSTAFSPVNRAFAEAQGDQYALTADNLLSAGPYILQGWNGTDISWKYVKNPYYWDKDNIYFDEIDIQVVKDANTAINLYEAGQLDGVSLNADYIPLFEGQPDLVKVSSLRMTNLEIGISSSEVLQNLNIRKALLYALDREELCSTVLNGAAIPAIGVIPDGIGLSPEGESVKESFGTLVYTDIAAAQAHFKAGLEELGVDSIELRLVTSDTDESIKIGTYLQAAYEKNLPGLKINLANVPASVRFDEMMSFDFDLALGGWTGGYDPTSYPNQFEASYPHNHAQWKAQELTELINALNNEDGSDFVARWEHLRLANLHLIENAVVVPLEQAINGYLVNPVLKGYTTSPMDSYVSIARAYIEE